LCKDEFLSLKFFFSFAKPDQLCGDGELLSRPANNLNAFMHQRADSCQAPRGAGRARVLILNIANRPRSPFFCIVSAQPVT